MEFTTLLLFAGALCIAAGSPGPSIAALVARVISRGHGSVWPFLAAMCGEDCQSDQRRHDGWCGRRDRRAEQLS